MSASRSGPQLGAITKTVAPASRARATFRAATRPPPTPTHGRLRAVLGGNGAALHQAALTLTPSRGEVGSDQAQHGAAQDPKAPPGELVERPEPAALVQAASHECLVALAAPEQDLSKLRPGR